MNVNRQIVKEEKKYGRKNMAYKIVVDSGHGGEDPGAVYPGRQEKEDTLRLALEVGRLLEAGGQDVVYTRTTDVYQTPFEKAQIANRE